jgi:uncharacterized membrane protein (DUF373 family)
VLTQFGTVGSFSVKRIVRVFTRAARVLLCCLAGTILLCLLLGLLKTILDFKLLFQENLETAFHSLLIDFLVLLATVEIYKTTITYLARGRVKVTYIIDTVFILMLCEVITLWFKGVELVPGLMIVLLLATLVFVRVLTIRYSPNGYAKEVRSTGSG